MPFLTLHIYMYINPSLPTSLMMPFTIFIAAYHCYIRIIWHSTCRWISSTINFLHLLPTGIPDLIRENGSIFPLSMHLSRRSCTQVKQRIPSIGQLSGICKSKEPSEHSYMLRATINSSSHCVLLASVFL